MRTQKFALTRSLYTVPLKTNLTVTVTFLHFLYSGSAAFGLAVAVFLPHPFSLLLVVVRFCLTSISIACRKLCRRHETQDSEGLEAHARTCQKIKLTTPKLKKYIPRTFLIQYSSFNLSKLWKAKFFILCDVILLMRLQEKLDHSWEWKG